MINNESIKMNIKQQQTNPELLIALFKSIQHKSSKEEIHKRRVSFIVGSMKPNSTVTREEIERILTKQE